MHSPIKVALCVLVYFSCEQCTFACSPDMMRYLGETVGPYLREFLQLHVDVVEPDPRKCGQPNDRCRLESDCCPENECTMMNGKPQEEGIHMICTPKNYDKYVKKTTTLRVETKKSHEVSVSSNENDNNNYSGYGYGYGGVKNSNDYDERSQKNKNAKKLQNKEAEYGTTKFNDEMFRMHSFEHNSNSSDSYLEANSLNESVSSMITSTDSNMITSTDSNMITSTDSNMITSTDSNIITSTVSSMITSTDSSMINQKSTTRFGFLNYNSNDYDESSGKNENEIDKKLKNKETEYGTTTFNDAMVSMQSFEYNSNLETDNSPNESVSSMITSTVSSMITNTDSIIITSTESNMINRKRTNRLGFLNYNSNDYDESLQKNENEVDKQLQNEVVVDSTTKLNDAMLGTQPLEYNSSSNDSNIETDIRSNESVSSTITRKPTKRFRLSNYNSNEYDESLLKNEIDGSTSPSVFNFLSNTENSSNFSEINRTTRMAPTIYPTIPEYLKTEYNVSTLNPKLDKNEKIIEIFVKTTQKPCRLVASDKNESCVKGDEFRTVTASSDLNRTSDKKQSGNKTTEGLLKLDEDKNSSFLPKEITLTSTIKSEVNTNETSTMKGQSSVTINQSAVRIELTTSFTERTGKTTVTLAPETRNKLPSSTAVDIRVTENLFKNETSRVPEISDKNLTVKLTNSTENYFLEGHPINIKNETENLNQKNNTFPTKISIKTKNIINFINQTKNKLVRNLETLGQSFLRILNKTENIAEIERRKNETTENTSPEDDFSNNDDLFAVIKNKLLVAENITGPNKLINSIKLLKSLYSSKLNFKKNLEIIKDKFYDIFPELNRTTNYIPRFNEMEIDRNILKNISRVEKL